MCSLNCRNSTTGMKKYFILASILAAVFVLTGCSIGMPTPSLNQQPKESTFTQSIWKSTDGGKTWGAINKYTGKLAAADPDIFRIAIDPLDSNNIYLGLRTGGVLKSTDAGEHWQATNFVSEKVYGLEIDPTDGKTLYVSGVWQNIGKFFKSTDGGQNWTEIYTEAAANGPLIIASAIDKNNHQVVYASDSGNIVLKSSDGGSSWKNVYKANSPVIKIAIDSRDSNLIYLLTNDGGIIRSRDGAGTFQDITANTSGKAGFSGGFGIRGSFKVLAVDPGMSQGVYLAGGQGIIRSNDGGDNWTQVAALNDAENYPVSAIAINPKNSREIVYGAAQAIYKSTDGGSNWTTFQFSTPKSISAIEYDPVNPNVIYLGLKKQ